MKNKFYNIIFLDINKLILDDNKEINEGDKLKNEIKEQFDFIESILNEFVESHLLIDVEYEEKILLKLTNFIYQVEKGLTKNYRFLLFRKIDKNIINIYIDAIFIILDLENEKSKKLLESLVEINKINEKLKIYIVGTYKSDEKIILTKENIKDFFIDQPYDYKYTQININNKNKNEINQKFDKFIEEAMFDVYNSEKEDDKINIKIKKKYVNKEKGENDSFSQCSLF